MPMSQGKCSDSGVSGITYIDLLRHGEVEGGVRFRGSTDHPLTAEGWAQMWAAVGTDIHWDRIVTSPLTRCADFARALSRYRVQGVRLNHQHPLGAFQVSLVADPDCRLYRKSEGQQAKLCYLGHLMMENRNGFIVEGQVTPASGSAEREAAAEMVEALRGERRKTLGADKAYDTAEFVARGALAAGHGRDQRARSRGRHR
jgi:hypothetical protein